MQRLVARSNVPRIDTRSHRLDALALAWQAQTHEIRAQRLSRSL